MKMRLVPGTDKVWTAATCQALANWSLVNNYELDLLGQACAACWIQEEHLHC